MVTHSLSTCSFRGFLALDFVLTLNNHIKDKTVIAIPNSLSTRKKLTPVPCRLSNVILGRWVRQITSNETVITDWWYLTVQDYWWMISLLLSLSHGPEHTSVCSTMFMTMWTVGADCTVTHTFVYIYTQCSEIRHVHMHVCPAVYSVLKVLCTFYDINILDSYSMTEKTDT